MDRSDRDKMGPEMNTKDDPVYTTLSPLIGLQLSWAGYAASMRTLGFGPDEVEVVSRTGDRKFTSPYALHIQCAWRLVKGTIIVTGSDDWWFPESGRWHPEWDPAKDGRLQEAILRKLLCDDDLSRRVLFNQTTLLTVMGVHVEDANGFTLLLSPDYRLTVFPSGTREEQWRLLNSRSGRHDYLEASQLQFCEPDENPSAPATN
jgi:hypothetical protein